ncbi:putative dehydrogenase [Catalinimonas alkaloidigena]|uniref:Gfo/Idh/MocA family protein n=1 Tax=Catalinimonas alkaloidigena TaxID=1075417 RepID=UPI0024053FB5|nr:Gfo/Idh/MocA family oxidoreductase [Catalinimonas alkaloidigena]MDF9798920.1 putative dehydrogenase [Catalinimonas alkaloidigena]
MKNTSRRKFILTNAAALSGLAAFGYSNASSVFAPFSTHLEKVRVGLIGVGSRGGGIAHVLKDLPGVELSACCDINEEHLQRGISMAAKGAKAYTDYQKMLSDKDLDALIIATPLSLHFPMAMHAVEAGKHVYLEKTMSYDIPQALKMVDKVNATKLVFQIGHQYRYYALYHKVHEVLSKGWCGEVKHYECQYHRNDDWRREVKDPKNEKLVNWRMYREFSGGLMAELCAHQLDIVNWMNDSPPLKVSGLGGIDYWKDGRETYDNVRTVYEYPNGVKASVSSVLSNAYKGYSIRILGTEATIEIQRDKAYLYTEADKAELGVVDGVSGATIKAWTQGEPSLLNYKTEDNAERSPTAYALLNFADCIRNDKKPFSNVDTGKDVSVAVHMGNKAMREEKYQYWKPEYSL